jgi:hypothetical protein
LPVLVLFALRIFLLLFFLKEILRLVAIIYIYNIKYKLL